MLRKAVVPDFTVDTMERADLMDPWSIRGLQLSSHPRRSSYGRQWCAALVIAGIRGTGAAWSFKARQIMSRASVTKKG